MWKLENIAQETSLGSKLLSIKEKKKAKKEIRRNWKVYMVSQSNLYLLRLSHQLYNYREPILVLYARMSNSSIIFTRQNTSLDILFTACYYFLSNKAQNKSVFRER